MVNLRKLRTEYGKGGETLTRVLSVIRSGELEPREACEATAYALSERFPPNGDAPSSPQRHLEIKQATEVLRKYIKGDPEKIERIEGQLEAHVDRSEKLLNRLHPEDDKDRRLSNVNIDDETIIKSRRRFRYGLVPATLGMFGAAVGTVYAHGAYEFHKLFGFNNSYMQELLHSRHLDQVLRAYAPAIGVAVLVTATGSILFHKYWSSKSASQKAVVKINQKDLIETTTGDLIKTINDNTTHP